MIRVTTIEPASMPPALTVADAPVWRDAFGNLYRVASGLVRDLPDGAWLAGDGPPPVPDPQAAVMIAGIEGLEALTFLGLTQPEVAF